MGKLLHSMQWRRSQIYNAVWGLSCHMTVASDFITQQYKLQ